MIGVVQENIGLYLATFIMWGFLMAFLYNMVKKSSFPGGDGTKMWISFTMFISYMASDPLLNITFGYDILDTTLAYLIWACSDIVIFFIVWLISKSKSISDEPVKLYISIGLSVNISLFLGMYFDINYAYTGSWWFWDVYSITVNLMDIMMLIALFINKDFLGLVKLYRKVRGQAEPA